MPTRSDYLRDLRDNPGATAEEVQRRVQAPTLAAVETQFRKCANANLIECDESRPRKYKLTEKGAAELHKLEPQNRSAIIKSNNGAVVEFDDARRVPNDVADPLEGRVSKARALLERIEALEDMSTHSESTPHADTESTHAASDVVALYLAQHELHSFGWSDRLFGEDSQVKARVADLEGKVGQEIADQAKRLVAVEREIHDDLWSDGTEVLRSVLELREALHLPTSIFGLGQREAGSSAAGGRQGENAQG
jgi:hypothetical protein